MTGKQHAVMWLGISLIIVRLFTSGQWQALWSTVTTSPSSAKKSGGGGSIPDWLIPLTIPFVSAPQNGTPSGGVYNIPT